MGTYQVIERGQWKFNVSAYSLGEALTLARQAYAQGHYSFVQSDIQIVKLGRY